MLPGSSWSMLSDSGPFRYIPSLQLLVFLETISSSVASPLSPCVKGQTEKLSETNSHWIFTFRSHKQLNWRKKQIFCHTLTLTRTFFFFLVLSLMLRGLFFWLAGFSTPPVPMFHLRPPNSSMAWASVGPSYLPSSYQRQTQTSRQTWRLNVQCLGN